MSQIQTETNTMKTLIFTLTLFGLFILPACGGSEAEGNEEDATDTVATTDETEHEEGGAAFEGVEKGNYLLYGQTDIDDEGAVSVAEMGEKIASNGKFEGKVQVEIAEVCQKAGCWIVFNDANGAPIRVFFRDHFTIPIETAIGTSAILYGNTQSDTLDVAFQKHILDDAKEAGKEVTQEEYDAITEDKIETTFDCEAILVAKQ